MCPNSTPRNGSASIRVPISEPEDAFVTIRRDDDVVLPEAERATTQWFIDEIGNLLLIFNLDGLACFTTWERDSARIRQKADEQLPEDLVMWCKRAHMNLVMSACLLGAAVMDDASKAKIFAAATGATRTDQPNSYWRPEQQ
jgi:hypothetical protein